MALQIKSLSKTYPGGIQALNNVSLTAPKGVFGLLGPNGAGKSTLMNTIASLQDPDEGSLSFNGINILREKERLRKVLGYLPQEFGFYPLISAEKLLNYLACLKGATNKPQRKKLVQELLELVNLAPYGKWPLGKYSGGMKQRLGIAQALIGQPQLLIVDEPTAGLDPEERVRFYNILSHLGGSITVILSTHIVGDVSAICQNTAIIQEGKMLMQDSPRQAIKIMEGKVWETEVEKSKEPEMREKHSVLSSRFFMGKIQLRIYSEQSPGKEFQPVAPLLEDCYFAFIYNFIES